MTGASKTVAPSSRLSLCRVRCVRCPATRDIGFSTDMQAGTRYGDGTTLAGRAFAALGWVSVGTAWRCPACWRREVAARGLAADIEAALQAWGAACGIEVVA